MKTKRILSLFIALLLCLSSFAVFAEEVVEVEIDLEGIYEDDPAAEVEVSTEEPVDEPAEEITANPEDEDDGSIDYSDMTNWAYWAENEGENYELHVELKADDMSLELRDELISVSKSGKNAAAKGIMGKIRAIAETMLLSASDPTIPIPDGEYYDCNGYNMGFGYMDPTIMYESGYVYTWSLFNYKTAVVEKEDDAYDELERSIVAKLADDIIVGVRGKKVEIVVKKAF